MWQQKVTGFSFCSNRNTCLIVDTLNFLNIAVACPAFQQSTRCIFTLRASCSAVYCNRSWLLLGVFVCGCVGLLYIHKYVIPDSVISVNMWIDAYKFSQLILCTCSFKFYISTLPLLMTTEPVFMEYIPVWLVCFKRGRVGLTPASD